MFPDGTFSKAPQEFLASMGNMWFASSRDTFIYALIKAQAGNWSPMNQFLLVASVYSDDRDCFFYRTDSTGMLRNWKVPVTKLDGIIRSIEFEGRRYEFRFGPKGTAEAMAVTSVAGAPGSLTEALDRKLDGYRRQVEVLSATQGWGALRANGSVQGRPLAIAGQPFEWGLGTHAASVITVRVPAAAHRLSGLCGIDDETEGKGSVTFYLATAGGEELCRSPVKRGRDEATPFDVDVTGMETIVLGVDATGSADNCHADWVNLAFR